LASTNAAARRGKAATLAPAATCSARHLSMASTRATEVTPAGYTVRQMSRAAKKGLDQVSVSAL
jgi:hypothetical protein